MSAKEKKKLVKGFPDLAFDATNACVLPADADKKLFDIVCEMKTTDVMKFAIMESYTTPLAGKALAFRHALMPAFRKKQTKRPKVLFGENRMAIPRRKS